MKVEIGSILYNNNDSLRLIPETKEEVKILKKIWDKRFIHVNVYREETGEIEIMSEKGIGIIRE